VKAIATLSRTQEILDGYGFHAKKKYGQNFIIDPHIIERIVNAAQVDKETSVIEVGPGIGALSEGLCQKAKEVKAFEIDEDMVKVLKDVLASQNNFEVVHQDFLKADLSAAIHEMTGHKVKIVANLPYYITTKLLEKIALAHQGIEEVFVMVQKDVAVKMSTSTDLRDRLPLTLFLKSIADVRLCFDVPRTVFMPSPNVDSAMLSIRFHKHSDLGNEFGFYQFLKCAFAARRKRLTNNLKSLSFKAPLVQLLENRGLAEDIRAEALSIEDLKYLYGQCTSAFF